MLSQVGIPCRAGKINYITTIQDTNSTEEQQTFIYIPFV